MSLISSLFTGVSGLLGNSKAMNVIGDNIANVNTVGFKGSKAVFGDLFSTVLNNGPTTSQLGRGSMLQGIIQSFDQGAFETSSSSLDLAIDGNGFFIVNNGIGNFYTRAGQFRLNEDGLVQAITGEILQGFEITQGVRGSTLKDIDLAGVQSAPQATTNFTLGANLNAAASAGTTFVSPVSIFNSVGTQVILSVAYTKLATGNSWSYTLNPSAGTVTSGASGTISFDTSGQLQDINGSLANQTVVVDYSSANPPAATQTLTWEVVNATGATNEKITGFAAESNNNSLVQNGFSTGRLVGLSVDSDGVINGLFNNGQSDDLFQVVLADFLAPTGLTRRGQNLFAESGQSGQPNIGFAEAGGFGSVLGGSLELSNVDLAKEFVTMIQTQQAFQASARIITTTDDLLSEAVNLVR